MIAMLASVRDEDEALLALGAGADVIDLKEPHAGALGAVPLPSIEAIVGRLRAISTVPISATIGDLPGDALEEMARRVAATARTGVDYVKVGLAPGPHLLAALRRLAALPAPVVPLFFADAGIDLAAIDAACALAFPVVMVDTVDKCSGSLFDCVSTASVRQLLERVLRSGARAGLAGSLRAEHVPLLRTLAPSIAGFRGALCEGGRTGRIDPARIRSLRAALQADNEDRWRARRGAASTAPARARDDAG